MLKLNLKNPIQSLNHFQGHHWTKKDNETKKWEKAIWAKCQGRPFKAKGKMKVRITSLRTRLLDHDNLIGGAKSLVDAMKRLEMIVDDSPEFVEVEYAQQKVGANQSQTVIELEVA